MPEQPTVQLGFKSSVQWLYSSSFWAVIYRFSTTFLTFTVLMHINNINGSPTRKMVHLLWCTSISILLLSIDMYWQQNNLFDNGLLIHLLYNSIFLTKNYTDHIQKELYSALLYGNSCYLTTLWNQQYTVQTITICRTISMPDKIYRSTHFR